MYGCTRQAPNRNCVLMAHNIKLGHFRKMAPSGRHPGSPWMHSSGALLRQTGEMFTFRQYSIHHSTVWLRYAGVFFYLDWRPNWDKASFSAWYSYNTPTAINWKVTLPITKHCTITSWTRSCWTPARLSLLLYEPYIQKYHCYDLNHSPIEYVECS